MPAFGAAIGLGAEEIEFDLWPTTDGEIVSCHDPVLDRVSDGTGKIYEKTFAELTACDFGVVEAGFEQRRDAVMRLGCNTLKLEAARIRADGGVECARRFPREKIAAA